MRMLAFCLLARVMCFAQPVTFKDARRSFDFPTGRFFETGTRACRPMVAASDFNGDGSIDLMAGEVTTMTGHGFRLAGLLGNGDGTFTPNSPPGDRTPETLPPVATADFDGDGIADVAIASGSSVMMAWGNGDGAFRLTSLEAFPLPALPVTLLAADVDADGIPDLVLMNEGTELITVFLNTGGGAFRRVTTSRTPTHPFSVAAGDFDRDGRLDLAIAHGGPVFPNWNPGSPGSGISIYLGGGDGTFRRGSEIASGSAVISLAGADFDGDGTLDLAVPGVSDGHPAIVVFAGLGNGEFREPVSAQTTPVCLAAADFNNDGKLDLLSQDTLARDVHLFLNTGNGTFQAPFEYRGGSRNVGVFAADFNGDGAADAALLDSGSTSAAVLLNDGEGAFIGPPDYPACCASPATHWVAAGDFDGDGVSEVLYTTAFPDSLLVLNTNTDPALSEMWSYRLTVGNFPPAVADFNRDGISDIAVFNDAGGVITILLGRVGDAPLMFYSAFIGFGAGVLSAADLNGDGVADLILTRFSGADLASSTIDILPGNGDGTFRPPNSLHLEIPSGIHKVVAGDFNGDGHADLLFSSQQTFQQSQALIFLAGAGDGSFAPPRAVEGLAGVNAIESADLNGDGILDLMVSDSRQGLMLLAGNGDGSFRISARLSSNPGGWRTFGAYAPFWIGDINGDGLPDLVYRVDSEVAVQLGNTEGTFSPLARFAASDFHWFAVADLNGDGRPDIVISHPAGVAVLWNTTTPAQ